MYSLQDKKVVILGGSGLIGSAVVVAFKERDAQMVNIDISGNADIYMNMSPNFIISEVNSQYARVDRESLIAFGIYRNMGICNYRLYPGYSFLACN
jgi:NAD(P)-dependent dehydrogenase (short-subunit alcohol dehydrogenase family)